VYSPWGAGGKFIEVVFSFSIASNCTANIYSTSLAIQALAPAFQKVPRAVWVIVAFVIYSE
jgi:purine-cytosine permease-like protein